MNQNNTEEMIQKPFIVNEELEMIIPKLSDEKFAVLKADIKSKGLLKPLDVMPNKTIIDGHNRYRACKDLGWEDYKIEFNVVNITQIQEAKEYSIEINFFRRQMGTYLASTWALNVFGKNYTEKELANKVALSQASISHVKTLNEKLVTLKNPAKSSEYKEKLIADEIGINEVLSQIVNSEAIDNIIACVDNVNGDIVAKIGKEKAKALKARLEAEFFEKKYDKKSLKEINTTIDKVIHPELYAPVEESPYATAAQKVAEKINDLYTKHSDMVKVFNVTTEDGFIETSEFIRAQAGKGKLYAIVTMFQLPKELVPE